MSFPDASEIPPVLEMAAREALHYLASLDDDLVLGPGAEAAARSLDGPLPDEGPGATEVLGRLVEAFPAATRSAGPRFFHFVTGGVTPAALAADWVCSALDQNSFSWVSSPLGARLETVALSWLKDLFGLPGDWAGVLTTGATMANFTGLAAARRWAGRAQGVDVEEDGLYRLPPIPVLSSGYLHTSARKALAMLGLGRANIRLLAADDTGALDLERLEEALVQLNGHPCILVGNAGEVNTGLFDPLEALADMAERHKAWLHVDGAFGIFARVTPQAATLAAGMERADSVAADGHKWLNVPYDCGFAFVADGQLLAESFRADAAYLPSPDDPTPNFGFLGPDMSRRARAMTVWATLAAYGRNGCRRMVERHLDLAQRVAARVEAADDLELLAPVPLNIVCFRYRSNGLDDGALDDVNTRLGQAVLEDGRVFVGTTRWQGRVAFRPAIVNWRTTEADVDLLIDVVRELGAKVSR